MHCDSSAFNQHPLASTDLAMAAKAGHIPDDSFNPFDGAAFLADKDEQPDGRQYVLIC